MFIFTIFAGFTGLLAFVASVVLTIVVLVRGLTIPEGRRGGPGCGRCGYGISLAASPEMCPECAARLDDVGVATPQMVARLREGPIAVYSAWVYLWCSVGALIGYFAFIALLFTNTGFATGNMSMSSTMVAAPVVESGQAGFEMTIAADVSTRVFSPPPIAVVTELPADAKGGPPPIPAAVPTGMTGLIELTVMPDQAAPEVSSELSRVTLEVDAESLAWTVLDASDRQVVSGQGVSVADAEAFLAAAGVPEGAERKRIAEDIVVGFSSGLYTPTFVDEFANPTLSVPQGWTRGFNVVSTTYNSAGFPAGDMFGGVGGVAGAVLAVLWMVLLAGGIVLIARRRSALTRAPSAPASA